jgi:hypothetical protein
MVPGTAYLRFLPAFDASLPAPLNDRLAAWTPEAIAVEERPQNRGQFRQTDILELICRNPVASTARLVTTSARKCNGNLSQSNEIDGLE